MSSTSTKKDNTGIVVIKREKRGYLVKQCLKFGYIEIGEKSN